MVGAGSLASILILLLSGAAASQEPGWTTEPNIDPPSFAYIEPESSNLNLDTVVLTCGEALERRVLQLQINSISEGPLLPAGADVRDLKDDPVAEIEIDGRTHRMKVYFADDFIVLADAVDHRIPVISPRLLQAMEVGRKMIIRFSLLETIPDRPLIFDSEATFNLQAGMGGAAVAAVRRCVSRAEERVSNAPGHLPPPT